MLDHGTDLLKVFTLPIIFHWRKWTENWNSPIFSGSQIPSENLLKISVRKSLRRKENGISNCKIYYFDIKIIFGPLIQFLKKLQIFISQHDKLNSMYLKYFRHSLSPTFILGSRVSWASALEWVALQNVICSRNLAHLFLLATSTDTGGDDLTVTGDGDTCKVETSLWFSTIFTNPAYYYQYGVCISMAPLLGLMERGDSPYAMISWPCLA